MGPHAARALRTASRIDAGSPALAGNAAASMRLPFRAVTPAASLSSLRATSATEKPEAPNFSATALEMPGPNPTTRIVFPTCPPMMCAMLRLPHVETARQVVLSKATDQRGGAQLSSSLMCMLQVTEAMSGKSVFARMSGIGATAIAMSLLAGCNLGASGQADPDGGAVVAEGGDADDGIQTLADPAAAAAACKHYYAAQYQRCGGPV